MTDRKSSEPNDLENLKISALLDFINQHHHSFLIRTVIKIENEFLKVNFAEKIHFISYLTRWTMRKIRKIIIKKYLLFLGFFKHKTLMDDSSVLRIAVYTNGGIGDLVNTSAFLSAFSEKWADVKFDIYFHNPESAQFIFSKASFIHGIHYDFMLNTNASNYDLIFTLVDWLKIKVVENKYKPHPATVEIMRIFEEAKNRFSHYELFVKKHPLLDWYYANAMVAKGFNRISSPGYFMNLTITKQHFKIYPNLPGVDYLKSLSLTLHSYITVHDGFDNDFINKTEVSTKQWSIAQWEVLCKKIRTAFPDLKIVQLGANKSRPIPNVTHSLINKTSLEEAALLLQGAKLHIDGESGLVRIASSLGTLCIVLFGPTNIDYFSIKDNINLRPTQCGGCYWLTDDWMAKCPRKLKDPECMESISPEHVFHAAKPVLEG